MTCVVFPLDDVVLEVGIVRLCCVKGKLLPLPRVQQSFRALGNHENVPLVLIALWSKLRYLLSKASLFLQSQVAHHFKFEHKVLLLESPSHGICHPGNDSFPWQPLYWMVSLLWECWITAVPVCPPSLGPWGWATEVSLLSPIHRCSLSLDYPDPSITFRLETKAYLFSPGE